MYDFGGPDGGAVPGPEECRLSVCWWRSRLLCRMIVFDRHTKAPGDGFGNGLDRRRHAQQVAPLGGSILHLDIAGNPLRVIRWQAHFVERAAWPAVQHDAAQFAHKALAHALLHDPAYLHVRRREHVLAGQRFWPHDDLLWHAHAVPGIEAPAITIHDALARRA